MGQGAGSFALPTPLPILVQFLAGAIRREFWPFMSCDHQHRSACTLPSLAEAGESQTQAWALPYSKVQ